MDWPLPLQTRIAHRSASHAVPTLQLLAGWRFFPLTETKPWRELAVANTREQALVPPSQACLRCKRTRTNMPSGSPSKETQCRIRDQGVPSSVYRAAGERHGSRLKVLAQESRLGVWWLELGDEMKRCSTPKLPFLVTSYKKRKIDCPTSSFSHHCTCSTRSIQINGNS